MEREVVAVGIDVLGIKRINLDIVVKILLYFFARKDHLVFQSRLGWRVDSLTCQTDFVCD